MLAINVTVVLPEDGCTVALDSEGNGDVSLVVIKVLIVMTLTEVLRLITIT
jgi:hypothetical protein